MKVTIPLSQVDLITTGPEHDGPLETAASI